MNAPPASPSNKDVSRTDVSRTHGTHEEIRSPELGTARTRDRLLQRVLAARKRLPQRPASTLARIR